VHPNEIWFGTSVKARVLRGILTPISWLYGAGWQAYLAFYRWGLKRAHEPHCPVVVIGNLVTGGSGKSPVTLRVASSIRELGHEVVIGCSGYGSPAAQDGTIAPAGELEARRWGDEPAMIRWLLPSIELVVGRARVRAAQLVHDRHPGAVLLMDDGFQHLPLRKHVSIVIEEADPASTRCLPAGPYREPRSNLGRADAILWSGESRGELPQLPQVAQFHLVRDPIRFVSVAGDAVEVHRATCLCAIGRPERFLAELRSRLELVDPLVLGDHDPLTSGNLLERLPPALPVVVTAKDWVKLKERQDVGTRDFIIALQGVRIEPEAEFRTWLAQKLDESKAKQGSR
jgi:tetraacyldisaccharide 4'-kinase